MTKVKLALVSVSDKTGLVDFVRGLHGMGVEFISTGGTKKVIAEAGIPVKDISEYTGFPEMMNGRVKTLHPKVHGGLLALRDNPEHMAIAKEHGISMIDMVVVNLYPFEATVAKPDVTLEDAIENIDIGGPSMVRSAAKNYRSVAIVTNPNRYGQILDEMRENDGAVTDRTRAELAVEAYTLTSGYDTAISTWLRKNMLGEEGLPSVQTIRGEKDHDVRYGENPHQKAAFYRLANTKPYGLSAANVLQGKELSFNNYLDLEAVLTGVRGFDDPTAYIVKHLSPCGVASNADLATAYTQALECDPLSAFGGIVGFNREVDGATAQAMLDGIVKYGFLECVLAPKFSAEARELLAVKKNLRLVEVADLAAQDPYDYKRVTGGFVMQENDNELGLDDLKVVTKVAPTPEQLEELKFAWKVCKTTKSNAIVYAKGTATVGIGGGVYSRVDANEIAAKKAGDKAKGAVLASDAFFPQPDNIDVAAQAGIVAIIEPGGSIKDQVVIDACDKLGIAMVFTGMRHFKH
ncbi:MAG TPA: bifunctional phosphoribosylaminoimidazolecarboxamide formyltransferase/IMP cyclohydrolase [Armatimonadota bacterium]|nr:bifunctional phosphoribosylaminoimidazolecarboxamide formyltransferase/IMP cyclohydrolase [Armatimonadota bacterium]